MNRVLEHVQQPMLNSTFSQRGMAIPWCSRQGGREGEENLADPQSSLVTLWTRCSFYNYSMAHFDLSLRSTVVFFFLTFDQKALVYMFARVGHLEEHLSQAQKHVRLMIQ